MDNLVGILLGNGIYPFPLDNIENHTRYYESSSINIVITKVNVSFTAGPQRHNHNSYEFLIPFKAMPYIGCEDKIYFVPKNMVFPFNPLQDHGPQGDMVNSLFAAIHIESDFMRRVARESYGENEINFVNEPIPLSDELKLMIENFVTESGKSAVGEKLVMDSISTQIAVQLIRDFKSFQGASFAAPKIGSRAEFQKVVNSFYENYSSPGYSTQSAAKEANLSKYYFIKAFKNETGKTPYDFLLDIRINKARELLKQGDLTITEIYTQCGFNNHSHFTTTFKKKAGMSPSLFRKVYTLG